MAKKVGQIDIQRGPLAIYKQSSGQSQNLQEWKDENGVNLSIVDPNGYAFPRPITFILAQGVPASTGTNKTNEIIVERAGKIVKAFIYAKTAPTGADLIVDINKNGTSIWNSTQANRLKLVATNSSGTATSFDTTTVAEADRITIDIDQVGSTISGQDITVSLLILLKNQ